MKYLLETRLLEDS